MPQGKTIQISQTIHNFIRKERRGIEEGIAATALWIGLTVLVLTKVSMPGVEQESQGLQQATNYAIQNANNPTVSSAINAVIQQGNIYLAPGTSSAAKAQTAVNSAFMSQANYADINLSNLLQNHGFALAEHGISLINTASPWMYVGAVFAAAFAVVGVPKAYRLIRKERTAPAK